MELILCIKIFLARIIDVSLGTFRTLVTVKGKNMVAACIGFVEVLVWFLIVKEALNTDSNSIWIGISYALGFATGTFVGGYISNIFIKGTLSCFVITSIPYPMIDNIRKNGFAVSIFDVNNENKKEKRWMIFMEIDKRKLKFVENLIKKHDKKAFIVASESHYVANGYFQGAK